MVDSRFKLEGAPVDAARQLLFAEQGEPSLHQVEPRGTGGSEVHVKARPLGEPSSDEGSLVGAVVVNDEMHVQFGGYRGLNGIEELAELDGAVAFVAPTDDRACLGFESGEQGRGAMPNVVMRTPLGLAWPHGQQRPGAVQCLDLGLLVHTQYQRSIGRIEVQPHNITDFFDEERV